MTATSTYRNGTGKEPEKHEVEHRFGETLAQLPALPMPAETANGSIVRVDKSHRNGNGQHANRATIALFCYENPESSVGQYVNHIASALLQRNIDVHLFTRQPNGKSAQGVHVHVVGKCSGNEILDQVEEFTRLAYRAFTEIFPDQDGPVALFGCEWSSVPVLELLKIERKSEYLLSLNSLEQQRGDMQGEASKRIAEIEQTGLLEATAVLTQQASLVDIVRGCVADAASKLLPASLPFPTRPFDSKLDPGVVKARFQIGPVDPTVLFIGDMDERHAPDVLMKSVPTLLRNHRQMRFVFVGDGAEWWPLRVHSRYLLLEHAVRMVGHMEGQPLYDLIQASDVVVVPSREQTEWWPIQAAWAAHRPVVASHQVGAQLIEHERNGVLIYPHESSCIWGVERLLFDEGLLRKVSARGHEKLQERFGWNCAAEQIEQLLGVAHQVH